MSKSGNSKSAPKKPDSKTRVKGARNVFRKTDKKKSKGTPSQDRNLLKRWIKRAAILVVLVILSPFLLVPLYSVVNPVSTLMIADLVSGKSYKREWRDLEDIGNVLQYSVMMSEDGQFCSHHGVDWRAVKDVLEDLQGGKKARGASTITMQTTKNLFLWNGRSFIRKALELPIALYLDFVLPKRRILEIYLNIAEWGDGIYGIEAAAQHYYKRSAAKLSRGQASLLTVTLPNPYVRNPRKPSHGMNRIAKIIRLRADKAGAYIQCLKQDAKE